MRYVTLPVFILALFTTPFADVIPYTSGKLAGSFDVTFTSNTPSPAIVQIGNKFSFTPYWAANGLAVCSNRGEYGLQIAAAIARRRPNGDTSWSAYNQYPSSISAMLNLDSVPKIASPSGGGFTSPSPLTKARGYIFAYPGDNQCQGPTYAFDSNYAQVVFLQTAESAVPHYAKVKIWSYSQTTGGTTLYPTKTLNKITVRYVITDNVNDLSDPPSGIRFAMKKPGDFSSDGFDFYSPLGRKLGVAILKPGIPALRVNSHTVRPVHPATP